MNAAGAVEACAARFWVAGQHASPCAWSCNIASLPFNNGQACTPLMAWSSIETSTRPPIGGCRLSPPSLEMPAVHGHGVWPPAAGGPPPPAGPPPAPRCSRHARTLLPPSLLQAAEACICWVEPLDPVSDTSTHRPPSSAHRNLNPVYRSPSSNSDTSGPYQARAPSRPRARGGCMEPGVGPLPCSHFGDGFFVCRVARASPIPLRMSAFVLLL
jgi:hypothetical protein